MDEKGPKGLLNALVTLGQLRDDMLVLGTIVYLLGYASWSAYAWEERLGPVAALDAQYFAAGVPIALLLSLTLLTIFGLRLISDIHWRRYFEQQTERRQRHLDTVLMLGAAAIVATGAVLLKMKPFRFADWVAILAITVGYVVIHLRGARLGKPNLFERFVPTILLIVMGMLAVGQFATVIYRSIPDAFGGGRPREVRLDIRVDAVSPATIRRLLDPGVPIPLARIIHDV